MSMISARIERLPFARFHVHLLLMGGLGYLFDAMDAAVLAFILPVLRTAWGLTNVETGVLGSSTFVGYLFGALLAGTLGDLIGRRAVMMSALALYSAASLVSAAVDSWPAFFAARVVAGMGTGAESAIIAPYLAEFVARRYRGAFTGALAGFFSFGFVAAALLGYFIVPAYENGWRIVLVITAVPVVMLLWWRRSLPESPRWLESRGRAKEAEAVLDRIEAGFAREGRALPSPVAEPAAPAASSGTLLSNFAALLAGRQARITTMTWIMWLSITFSYYSFFVWIPGLLVQNGMSITKSFGYSLAMYCAQVPGYFTAAFFNERIGRQATIATYMLLGGASALGLAFAKSDAEIMTAGLLLSFFMNGTYAGVYAYTAEVFPTSIRTTGAGLASAIGRIGAIVAPILVGYLYPNFGFAGVFGVTTSVLLIGALTVVLMGVPTRGRSLEDIASKAA
ncbi:putative MFS transporter [Bradyrhizobium japonicum]|jgi:MFS transporter, putative metabolite:H+ symporter|uniref:MFS transporter n=1 Tax=Bradyrhizobium TaxID=374 RepID=UPI00039BA313|nr:MULTISPECIES: MFS transporter [Bradyrhizobium]MBP2434780.1 putative MFS transporter [Bradyrhizobium elkanii]MCP1731984.1 putative MFS transporter [Bradyrhizobium elkanii]MCP1932783.1 putative MFS transporter [Bradyrhizobium elkanii]MCP1968983.1 putative MFS transporter [Bradyrhizobium elkanii]MCS3479204.1 putative MFS transporter [Bradyrhizobium elkanii]